MALAPGALTLKIMILGQGPFAVGLWLAVGVAVVALRLARDPAQPVPHDRGPV